MHTNFRKDWLAIAAVAFASIIAMTVFFLAPHSTALMFIASLIGGAAGALLRRTILQELRATA